MEAITAVKAAAVVVKNKDNIGKIIGIIVLIFFMPVLLLIGLFLYIMSAFAPDGVLKSPTYFDGANSAIYSSLQVVTQPYYEELKEEMKERRKEIIKNNTYEYEITDENGEIKTVTVEPTVNRRIHYIPESLIIAYLIMENGIDTKNATINENMATAFLHSISYIEEIDQGNNTFLIENRILTEEEIADSYFTDESDRTKFLVTSNAYGEYFDVAETKVVMDDNSETPEGVIYSASLANVPLYLQYDITWGTQAYGNGTIKKNGCCPTCLAMVFSYLCQQNIYPNDVTAWAGNRYYVNGAGTSWSIFAPAATQWGVKCTNIGKSQNSMVEALGNGKIIIASMGPGTFTKGGHFIVLTGITEDGKIKVNDPNDSGTKRHSEKAFEQSLIIRECKNMWVFEK